MPDRYYIVSADYDTTTGRTINASVSLPESSTIADVDAIVRMMFRAGVEGVIPASTARYDDSKAETRVFTNDNGNFFNRA